VTYFDSTERGQHDLRAVGNGSPFCCEIDEVLLVPGRYRIDASVYCDGELHDHVEAAAFLEIQQGILRGRLVQREAQYGSVIMNHQWKTPV
jgi:lipopolysaccharide transport system ATP-binding protein